MKIETTTIHTHKKRMRINYHHFDVNFFLDKDENEVTQFYISTKDILSYPNFEHVISQFHVKMLI
jgi:hypothetical protein